MTKRAPGMRGHKQHTKPEIAALAHRNSSRNGRFTRVRQWL